MQKKWSYQPIPEEKQVIEFAAMLNLSLPIATILLQRGINTFEQANLFPIFLARLF